ncbi:MAG: hypothetical protein Q7R73_04155 [bacterium]|nr:hypothetical protein [bacterium]
MCSEIIRGTSHEFSVSTGDEDVQENLAPEEQREREQCVEFLKSGIDQWVSEHIPEGSEFNRELLGGLVQYIGTAMRDRVMAITKLCGNPEKYVSRPAIKVYEGRDGKTPDIWILGWRGMPEEQKAEETDIHDHMSSEAAFHVFQNTITEKMYAIDSRQWGRDNSVLEYQVVNRDLQQGSTATIESPYIHVVSGKKELTLAVTIHAYYPPLHRMTFYAEQDGVLKKTGYWQKEDCHC